MILDWAYLSQTNNICQYTPNICSRRNEDNIGESLPSNVHIHLFAVAETNTVLVKAYLQTLTYTCLQSQKQTQCIHLHAVAETNTVYIHLFAVAETCYRWKLTFKRWHTLVCNRRNKHSIYILVCVTETNIILAESLPSNVDIYLFASQKQT